MVREVYCNYKRRDSGLRVGVATSSAASDTTRRARYAVCMERHQVPRRLVCDQLQARCIEDTKGRRIRCAIVHYRHQHAIIFGGAAWAWDKVSFGQEDTVRVPFA